LGGVGTAAKATESALIEAVHDPDEQVRQASAWAPGKVRGQ